MVIMLEVDTANDAFVNGAFGKEVGRLLRLAAARIEKEGKKVSTFPLLDINGNTCGRVEVDHG
jgi:hypothetical protein